MTIDNIKDKWHSLETPSLSEGSPEDFQKVQRTAIERGKTAYARMSARFMRLGIIAFAVAVAAIPACQELGLSGWSISLYVVTMLLLGTLKIAVSRRMRKTDVFSLPVVEAATELIRIRRFSARMRMAGFVVALPALSVLFMEFAQSSDRGMIYGAVAGAAAGVVIAIVSGIQIRRNFRKMMAPFVVESE